MTSLSYTFGVNTQVLFVTSSSSFSVWKELEVKKRRREKKESEVWLKEKKESDISDVTQEHNTLKNEGLSTVRDEFQKMLLILA